MASFYSTGPVAPLAPFRSVPATKRASIAYSSFCLEVIRQPKCSVVFCSLTDTKG